MLTSPSQEPTYRLEHEWVCCVCGWNYLLDTTPRMSNPRCSCPLSQDRPFASRLTPSASDFHLCEETTDIRRTECVNITCQHARCDENCRVTARWVPQ